MSFYWVTSVLDLCQHRNDAQRGGGLSSISSGSLELFSFHFASRACRVTITQHMFFKEVEKEKLHLLRFLNIFSKIPRLSQIKFSTSIKSPLHTALCKKFLSYYSFLYILLPVSETWAIVLGNGCPGFLKVFERVFFTFSFFINFESLGNRWEYSRWLSLTLDWKSVETDLIWSF